MVVMEGIWSEGLIGDFGMKQVLQLYIVIVEVLYFLQIAKGIMRGLSILMWDTNNFIKKTASEGVIYLKKTQQKIQ